MRRARGKYGAKKTVVEGYTFDSKAEARRYVALKLMQMAGAISGLKVHPAYILLDPFKVAGKTIRGISYEADFSYMDHDRNKNVVLVAEDVKGVETAVFKLKAKLFQHRYPHIELRITHVR